MATDNEMLVWDSEFPEDEVYDDYGQISSSGRWYIYGTNFHMEASDLEVNTNVYCSEDAIFGGAIAMGEDIYIPPVEATTIQADVSIIYNGISTRDLIQQVTLNIPDGLIDGQQIFIHHIKLATGDLTQSIKVQATHSAYWPLFVLGDNGLMHLAWVNGAWTIITAIASQQL
jgi:hypothetical protein